MHDCLRTAVPAPAERGLQVKADPMNSVSRHTGWRRLLYGHNETVRVELAAEASLAQGKVQTPIIAARRPLQIERPIR